MEQTKIDRINELARKSRTESLNEAELAEQAALRKEYIEGYRRNLKAQLDNMVITEKDGTVRPLKRSGDNTN